MKKLFIINGREVADKDGDYIKVSELRDRLIEDKKDLERYWLANQR